MDKVVYEDDGKTKVLKGDILKEDEFTYTIQAEINKKTIIIGKRAVIQIYKVDEKWVVKTIH